MATTSFVYSYGRQHFSFTVLCTFPVLQLRGTEQHWREGSDKSLTSAEVGGAPRASIIMFDKSKYLTPCASLWGGEGALGCENKPDPSLTWPPATAVSALTPETCPVFSSAPSSTKEKDWVNCLISFSSRRNLLRPPHLLGPCLLQATLTTFHICAVCFNFSFNREQRNLSFWSPS